MFAFNKLLLQVLKYRQHYESLEPTLKHVTLDVITQRYVDLYKIYFKKFEHAVVNRDVLLSLMYTSHYKPEDIEFINGSVDALMVQPDDSAIKGIRKGLQELSYSNYLQELLTNYADGKEVDLYTDVVGLSQEYSQDLKLEVNDKAVEYDFGRILEEVYDGGNTLKWGMQCLNNSMANLQTGKFIIIAGRPDIGKSSFTAQEAVNFVKQVPEDRTVLILTNEGKKEEWFASCMRAAFNRDLGDLSQHDPKLIMSMFRDITTCQTSEKLQIFSINGKGMPYIEALVQELNPMVVVMDMIDNVPGFENTKRDDQRYEKLYQWFRDCCIQYNFLGLGLSQISADGAGVEYPSKRHLANSKTGKQGACDAQIMIGHKSGLDYERSRYLSIPKNKFMQTKREDGTYYPKACYTEVWFKWEISRFLEGEQI